MSYHVNARRYYQRNGFSSRGGHSHGRKPFLPSIPRNIHSELNTTKHLIVSGDRISYSNGPRNYVYHRQPFDWYNTNRSVILDDIEEILPIKGSLSRPHVRSIWNSAHYYKAFSRYAPPETCHENEDEHDEIKQDSEPKVGLKNLNSPNFPSLQPENHLNKKRILILHGYKHNKNDFYDKTEFLRNELKDLAEFVYIQAPHFISKSSPENNFQEQNAWWLKTKEFPNVDFPANFEKTLDFINKVCKTQGPFDGIFGFSQGGALTAILCNIIKNKQFGNKYDAIDFKFAVVVGTCKYDEEEYLSQFYDFENQIQIPTLHIFGKADTQISCQSSFELTEYFHNPKIFFHESGHTIPYDCLPSVREFIRQLELQ